MSAIKDRADQRFGRLVVLRDAGRTKKGNVKWECRCDCGSTLIVRSGDLGSGNTESCGCLQKERTGASGRTHGLTGTRTYVVWRNMIQRTSDPSVAHYHLYGGRGIRVCERWLSFEAFLADMGKCPPRLTIERMDNNGNYEPGNCRWATYKDQQNNRRNNHLVTYRGITQTLTQWSEHFGLSSATVRSRIKNGWPENTWFEPPWS